MAQDKDGRTPLHLAAGNRHCPAVKALLEMDNKRSTQEQQTRVKVDARDKYGQTALHWATRKEGNEEVIRLLVENGASVNARDSQQCAALPQPTAALEWGVKNKHNSMVRGIVEQVVDGEKGGLDYGQWTLGLAADYGAIETILQLVEDHSVNLKTLSGQKALVSVVESEDLDTMGIMIGKGADLDAEFEGKTVLYRAAEKRKWQIVKLLVKKGASINPKYEGKTALFRAAEAREYSDLEMLAEMGANVDAKFEGGTALWYGSGGIKAARILAKYGANVNFKYNGETPLSRAAAWSPTLAKVLIELGADVNVLVNGLPLLFRVLDEYSSRNPDERAHLWGLVKLVVERVTEGINDANDDGTTALHIAVETDLPEIVLQLVKKGANTEVENHVGIKLIELIK